MDQNPGCEQRSTAGSKFILTDHNLLCSTIITGTDTDGCRKRAEAPIAPWRRAAVIGSFTVALSPIADSRAAREHGAHVHGESTLEIVIDAGAVQAVLRGPASNFYGFEHAQLVIDHGDRRETAGMHYGAWLEDQGVRIEDYFGQNAYKDFGVWSLPEDLHYSKWTADRTIDAIERAGQSDRPFFLWSSFQDPHNPCFVPEPWASLHDEADIPDPVWDPEEFTSKPPFYRSTIERNRLDSEPLLTGPKDWACRDNTRYSSADYRRQVRLYRGMISLMDHHIGRIVRHLESTGQLDNTVIVFTSDHGEYLGNHGLWWKWLYAYEDAHRVPFLVYDPRCQTPGAMSSAIQSLIDIPQTFLRRADITAPPGLQGFEQTSAWQNAEARVRDHAIIEFRPTEGPFMQKTWIDARWKLVLYSPVSYGELYDLESDPDQLRNLWDHPDFATVRAERCLALLRAEMQEEGTLRERTMWA